LRILIVDDSASFLAACRGLLHGTELHVVGEAGTGAEALQRVKELSPDLVLLDIDLGEESGINVARELAERSGSVAPSVIFVSALPADDFAEIVEESPALGFIPKSELSAARVRELIGSVGGGSSGGNQRASR
jgi:DNA-binding NarL/FixJ family response regulator